MGVSWNHFRHCAQALGTGSHGQTDSTLQAALAREFDGDPWVEIFSFEETSRYSMSLPEGYSRTAMTTSVSATCRRNERLMAEYNGCILTNYFHSDENLRDLMDYFISKRVCVGGPDVLRRAWGAVAVSYQVDWVE